MALSALPTGCSTDFVDKAVRTRHSDDWRIVREPAKGRILGLDLMHEAQEIQGKKDCATSTGQHCQPLPPRCFIIAGKVQPADQD